MDKGHDGKPTVLLIHGMWSTQDTLSEVKEAFVAKGLTADSLCLPYHFPKAEHTEASRAKLAKTRVQDYVAFIIEQVKRLDSPLMLKAPLCRRTSTKAVLTNLAWPRFRSA